jgi:tetratricopeptide (TPR) repeat protein
MTPLDGEMDNFDPDVARDDQIDACERWNGLAHYANLGLEFAVSHLRDGEPDRAEAYLRDSLATAQVIGDGRLEYLTNWTLATLALHRADPVMARTHLLAARAITHQGEWFRLEEANVVRRLALLEMERGRLYGARRFFIEARQLYHDCEVGDDEATCLLQLGDIDLRLNRPNGARGHYVAAEKLIRRAGSRMQKAKMTRRFGDLASALGKSDAAQARYADALVALDDLAIAYPKPEIDEEREAILTKLAELAISDADRSPEDWTIEFARDPKEALAELQQVADVGLVVDIELRNATNLSGVLIGATESGLLLEAWNEDLDAPGGDPVTAALSDVVRITIQ